MSAALLADRRFGGLFWTQFLGALNDNFFKNALVLLILYRLAGDQGPLLVTAAAGIFILPFFLFSATAGQLADKYDRAWLTRRIKILEIGIMSVGAVALLAGSVTLLLVVLFAMGSQSTLFGPIKYGILPDLLERDELVAGNGLIEGGTFLAILIGTILGGVLVLAPGGTWIVSAGVLGLAAAGYATSRFVPPQVAPRPDLVIERNVVAATSALMRQLFADRRLRLAALGVSWFWFVGAVFLAQVPTFTKDVIGADEHVVTLFLTLFSIGIGIGSLAAARATRDRIDTTPVPFAAIAMAIFTVDLFFAARAVPPAGALMGLGAFVAEPFAWRLMVDLVAVAMAGGLFVVPLFAAIQAWADPDRRARVIAAVNIVNAAFMVASALITLALQTVGLDVAQIFLATGVANIAVALYVARLLPEDLLRGTARSLFKLLYRLDVRGGENLAKAGPRCVVVVNHLSLLDAPIMLSLLRDKPLFAIYTGMARRWWIRPFLTLVEALPIDPARPMAVKSLVARVKEGRRLVIFPEGRITVTGALMKVYDGPAMIADKADAVIVPVRIENAEQTPFSRLNRLQARRRWFPRIRVTFLPPRRLDLDPDVTGRARRSAAGDALYDLMCDLMVRTTDLDRTLFRAFGDAARRQGMGRPAVEDPTGAKLTFRRLEAAALALGAALDRRCAPGPESKAGPGSTSGLGSTAGPGSMAGPGSSGEPAEDERCHPPPVDTRGHGPGTTGSRSRPDSDDEPVSPAVGVMLPTSVAAAVTFLALQARGRVAAMINFTAGAADIVAACRTAGVTQIVTARAFVAQARLEALVEEIGRDIEIVRLEDVRGDLGRGDRLRALAATFVPSWRASATVARRPGDPAVVLFSSGTEGTPKAIVLSHRNLLANCAQIASRIDVNRQDRVFDILPVFHSFGLTGGLLLPLLSGVPTYLYPSPLHYGIVPELVYASNATIMFGTDTFLLGYARKAHPYDFRSLRYVFAGAEKVKEETRRLWMEKFGQRILEGYGLTETSPALALNTPMHNKSGTVGRLVPLVRHRLEPVEGIEEGGRLQVAGPNVMLGYGDPDRPGRIRPGGVDPQGWYDTGDIVTIDEAGFVRIVGRAKRFAKIGGEMVSLAAIEALLDRAWSEAAHAVVAIADPRKGERLVLLTTAADVDRATLQAHWKTAGRSELSLPQTILHRDTLPLLGTGKIDLAACGDMARKATRTNTAA